MKHLSKMVIYLICIFLCKDPVLSKGFVIMMVNSWLDYIMEDER